MLGMLFFFFYFFQWTAVLIGAVMVMSVVGVVVFLLYRRYKLSSQFSAGCTPQTHAVSVYLKIFSDEQVAELRVINLIV